MKLWTTVKNNCYRYCKCDLPSEIVAGKESGIDTQKIPVPYSIPSSVVGSLSTDISTIFLKDYQSAFMIELLVHCSTLSLTTRLVHLTNKSTMHSTIHKVLCIFKDTGYLTVDQ